MKQGWDPTRSSSSHKEFGQSLEQSPHVPLGAEIPAQDSGINKAGGGGSMLISCISDSGDRAKVLGTF